MPTLRGWCPDLFTPMQSGDGLLLRIKPRQGRIDASDGIGIAAEAARGGNGVIELTGRGNLQLRGFTPASARAFARFAVAAHLASPDPRIERRRNILVAPLAGAAARALGDALERELAADRRLDGLPGKFGFGVEAAAGWALPPAAADILLRESDGLCTVSLAGAVAWHGASIEAPAQAVALAAAWLGSGVLRPARDRAAIRPLAAPLGWMPGLGMFGFGLPFGQIDAARLARACRLAQRYGDGVLQLTPWRAILLGGIAQRHAPRLARALAGLVLSPDDPRAAARACIGNRGCASGSVDARADAALLLQGGLRVEALHVSGCAKGCAHPGPATITLVGQDGRYGLVRGGRAGDTPQLGALTLAGVQGSLAKTEYERDGAAIYARSFAIIRAEADLRGFTPEQVPLVLRVIHASGMVEIARSLRLHPDFVAAARAALRAGAPVFCDSEMVAHGVTRARLPAGNPVICTLRDPRTPDLARRLGTTRSAAALCLWGERLAGALVAIGNAPTALFQLLEMIAAGAPAPAAIIGMPVGFVGAAESKQALADHDGAPRAVPVPWAIVAGRQGGSAMAAAAVNALASEAP